MTNTKTIKDGLQNDAIQLVKSEFATWQDASAWVTERVEFVIRPLIRQLRKNYWGVFDEPYDPSTGRKKIWAPLTETVVEQTVKTYDLDQGDIKHLALNQNGTATARVVRPILQSYLSGIQFGEKLDAMERDLGIDGTAVWKIYEDKGRPVIRPVDLLNFFIDPSADNIQETPAVIERAVLPISVVKKMSGWINLDEVEGRTDIVPSDPVMMGLASNRGETKYVDVYERWGLAPKKFLTGKQKDEELVEMQIVVSGLDGSNPVLHLIKENSNKDKKTKNILKPYEEVRYSKVSGRWYGRGPAEKLIMLQLWMNIIINTRINRNIVAQLGLFKIRANSGITPQMLSRLPSMGAIKVNNLDDIEQMVLHEASQSSYADENTVQGWARAVTSAFEVVTGEGLPSSTPATNAVIQSQNAQGAFKMVKNAVGSFLERVIDRHVLPILAKNLKPNEVVRIVGNDESMDMYVDRLVAFALNERVDSMMSRGMIPTPESMEREVQVAKQSLLNNPELFISLQEKLLTENIDTQTFVGNQQLDTQSMVTNLVNTLNIAPELRNVLIPQIYNLMGLDAPRIPKGQAQARAPMENPQNIATLATQTRGASTGQIG